MKRKGISPLIAAVLLIAFTMAIAGIMATWATTFTRQRTEIIASEASCVGALQFDPLSLKFTTIGTDTAKTTGRVSNFARDLNVTDINFRIDYEDVSKASITFNKNISHIDPGKTSTFDLNLSEQGADNTKPKTITTWSDNCGPGYSASLRYT